MRGIFVYIRKVVYLTGSRKNQLPFIFGFFLLGTFLDLLGIGLVAPYVSIVLDPNNFIQSDIGNMLSEIGVFDDAKDLIVKGGILLVSIFLFKTLLGIFINYKIVLFSEGRLADIRTNLMKSYLRFPYERFLKRNSADYNNSIVFLSKEYAEESLLPLLRLLSNAVAVIFILIFLAWYNLLALSLLTVILGGVFIAFDRVSRKKVKTYGREVAESSQEIIKNVSEGVSGFKEVKILGSEDYFIGGLRDASNKYTKYFSRMLVIQQSPKFLLEFVLVLFVVILIAVLQATNSGTGDYISIFGVFGAAAMRLLPAVVIMSGCLSQIRGGQYAVAKLYEDIISLEQVKITAKNEPSKEEYSGFKNIKFDEVTFSYDTSDKNILKKVSLEIQSGESIGIIGTSGEGKTTILDILLGLLKPTEGRIWYNGHYMEDHLKNWQSQVAYLPQEVFLTDDTLRRNIALGVKDGDIDDQIIQKSLKQAKLYDLVKALPEGIETFLGDRGVRLSGGQRQRVALARAFYHQREVLVFDEATSALDHETEREIVDEINRYKGKKTMIVIAHRLTTVAHCDRIYKIQGGKISLETLSTIGKSDK